MTTLAARKPASLGAADRHLISRFSYGWTPALGREVAAAGGGRRWFEQQLRPGAIADPAGDAIDRQRWWPVLHKSAGAQWQDHLSGRRRFWEAGYDLSRRSMARKLVSRRQVHEVMASFWLDHLHVPAGEDRSGPHRASYEALVRQHALGRFSDLLVAAVQHPAMVGYLTGDQNTRHGPNENLGRELLELHTVGVGARYGEAGVKSSARILTGYTVDVGRSWRAGYSPALHATGTVRVLGFTHPNRQADGRPVVRAYLRYLATHRLTAARIARKLCIRFVSDAPSAAIVAAVTRAYLRSGSDIKTTLRALVSHRDFAAARGAKTRTPVEDVIATARATGTVPRKPTGREDRSFVTHLSWMAENIGDRPYLWPRPDGPPDTAAAWATAPRMLRSFDIHHALPAGWWKSQDVTYAPRTAYLPTSWPRRLDEVVRHVGITMSGAPPSSAAVGATCRLLGRAGSSPVRSAAAVSDWDFLRIRGTLLNAPEHLQR